MKRIIIAASLVAATTWVSCTPDKKTEETEIAETTSDEQTPDAVTDSTLSDEKKELMQTIARHTMLQTELGKLAAEKGTTAEVKQNGQEMVQLYTTQQTELQDLAKTYNLSLNTTLAEKEQKHLNNLKEKSGVEFDKEYWKIVTDAQKETLDEYEDLLRRITPDDATAFGTWARTSEKELRAQYEQTLAKKLELKTRT